MISSPKNEEMWSGINEKKMEWQSRSSRGKPGISLCIAKISQGLRKFRNHSENFAILAKFSLCTNFR